MRSLTSILDRRSIVALLLAVFLPMTIDGCGFRLRGSLTEAVDLPPTHVKTQSLVSLKSVLERALKNANVSLVANENDAELVIVLVSERKSRRVLSVTSSGKAQEYELHYAVVFGAHDKKGNAVVSNQTVQSDRDFTFSETDVLAKDVEEKRLYSDMQQSAVNSILLRVQAKLAKR